MTSTSLVVEREREAATKPFRNVLDEMNSGFIFIAGPTCSGKTTLSHTLENYFWDKHYSVNIIREDDYFKDLKNMPRSRKGYMTDSMDAFHTDEMKEDVKSYIKNGRVELPIYDVAKNKRIVSKQYIVKSNVTIVEGLHVISLFHGKIDGIFIYMDTPIDVCLERRLKRDTMLYHIPRARIEEHFKDCIMPSYEKEILPQSKKHGVILRSS